MVKRKKDVFEIIPAIDILGGQVVRLVQGDYKKKTVFSNDPVAMAKHWAKQGAPRLHVVDLDGAKAGHPVNLPVIKKIVKAVKIPVQVGGGFRTLSDIKKAIQIGVDRVILGTAAAQNLDPVARSTRNPDLISEAVRLWPGRIAVGIDVKDGLVATSGWTEKTGLEPIGFIRRLWDKGVRIFIYTNISRDGTLSGPELEGTMKIAFYLKSLAQRGKKEKPFDLIASGGISSQVDIDKLAQLRNLGLSGAIAGRALYDGKIKLGFNN